MIAENKAELTTLLRGFQHLAAATYERERLGKLLQIISEIQVMLDENRGSANETERAKFVPSSN